MKVVLLRVGIDLGAGGIHAPLFKDGSFEYMPIADETKVRDKNGNPTGKVGIDERTYGNTKGRSGRYLIDFFPEKKQEKMRSQPMHVDPEFETNTYGDPVKKGPKRSLLKLQKGDMLVFYCGLQGWDFKSEPALYIMGYFEVEKACVATEFTAKEIQQDFGKNFHVKHKVVFDRQKDDLMLIKGTANSRLLKKAALISDMGEDVNGKPRRVLSKKAQKIFGDFDGRIDIQRSVPRWIREEFINGTKEFLLNLD